MPPTSTVTDAPSTVTDAPVVTVPEITNPSPCSAALTMSSSAIVSSATDSIPALSTCTVNVTSADAS